MDELPFVLVLSICAYLEPYEIYKLASIDKKTQSGIFDEEFWKKMCLKYFPWFFWNGKCAGKYEPIFRNHLRDNGIPTSPLKTPSSHTPITLKMKKEFICSSECSKTIKNPYHPLPNSWRESFRLIYTGNYSGLMQIINSLEHREMSAFTALATYDYKTKSFAVCYRPSIISKYRRGELVFLNRQTPRSWISEIINVDQRNRFRRIPAKMVSFDCRELYSQDIFNMPISKDGRPCFLKGDHVEVQWRANSNTEYAWWKGRVVQNFMKEEYLEENDDGIEFPNIPFSDDIDQGILVHFPHYPLNSPWSTVVASNFGNECLNDNGLVGGIRKVECVWHAFQWDLFMGDSIKSIAAMLQNGDPPFEEQVQGQLVGENGQ
jgi:hypothetical protein